jgi:hypothetical protein
MPTKLAVLPAGFAVRVHENVNTSPFASLLALASSVTDVPATTFWAVPALATGAAFATDATTETVEALLLGDVPESVERMS